MIRVSVSLISAVNGKVTELARMDICNDGSGERNHMHYDGEAVLFEGTSYIGRDSTALDRGTVSKRGRITNWPSERLHIWNLVRAMLVNMGYGKQ